MKAGVNMCYDFIAYWWDKWFN